MGILSSVLHGLRSVAANQIKSQTGIDVGYLSTGDLNKAFKGSYKTVYEKCTAYLQKLPDEKFKSIDEYSLSGSQLAAYRDECDAGGCKLRYNRTLIIRKSGFLMNKYCYMYYGYSSHLINLFQLSLELAEAFQGALQVLNDVNSQLVGRRKVVQIGQGLILYPEDIQARLVSFENFVSTEPAPASVRIFLRSGKSAAPDNLRRIRRHPGADYTFPRPLKLYLMTGHSFSSSSSSHISR